MTATGFHATYWVVVGAGMGRLRIADAQDGERSLKFILTGEMHFQVKMYHRNAIKY